MQFSKHLLASYSSVLQTTWINEYSAPLLLPLLSLQARLSFCSQTITSSRSWMFMNFSGFTKIQTFCMNEVSACIAFQNSWIKVYNFCKARRKVANDYFLMIATSFQTLSVPAVAVSKYRYYFSTLSFDMPVHMRITIRASGNVKACLQRVVSFPPFCLLHTCSPKRAYIYVVVEASSAPSRGKRKRFSEKVIGSSA